MSDKPLYKPGEDNHRPGEYIEVGPRGARSKADNDHSR